MCIPHILAIYGISYIHKKAKKWGIPVNGYSAKDRISSQLIRAG